MTGKKLPDYSVAYNFEIVRVDSSVYTGPVAVASMCCFVVQAVITDNRASCIHRCCISNNTEELMQLV